MSEKETVSLEAVIENLKRPNEAGDLIAPIKPLQQESDEVYSSLHSVLTAEEGVDSKINKNKE